MHATGLVLVACSVGYWVWLQGTPAYIAMRGAEAVFADPDAADGLPWQIEEVRVLGYNDKKAVETLEMIREEYLQGAELVSGGEFLKVVGKDAYMAKVRTPEGKIIDVPVVVIDQNGRGIVQLSDLISAARIYYYERERIEKGAGKDVLNGFSQKLVASGLAGYYDVPFDKIQPWREYGSSTEEVASN